MQQIRFGLALDGERGWHARTALGESTVGPLGLLTLLETQLGLTRLTPSTAERIVQMRGCLKRACTGERFYEKSFELDEFGTAAEILAWRDTWYQNGWDGSVPTDSAPRLLDMAAIDALAGPCVFPGMGQRLNEIADLLASRQPQIATIELVEPLDELPVAWQRVLHQLPIEALREPLKAAAPAGSMLSALQNAVLEIGDQRSANKLRWRDDGSVTVMRAETELAAAEWLAARVRHHADPADRLFVIEGTGMRLDTALACMDQPLLGSSESSTFRPALQLLPLALRLLWEPLDFKALMQFLTHPVGPLRSFARRALAEKIADHPGIGGEAWKDALASVRAHYGEDGEQIVQDITFWLEGPSFGARSLAPVGVIRARVHRLAEYFLTEMTTADPVVRAPWAAAREQAAAIDRALLALEAQAVPGLNADTLDRLVSQAAAHGCDNPLLRSEAGSSGHVRAPGAVIEPFAEVCWWHLAAVPLAQPYPWSPREIAELRALGVALPEMSRVLERQARSWLQPLLAARQRLTLMLPRAGAEVHPLWLMLSSLLEAPTILEVERVLIDDANVRGVSEVPHRPLPKARRWFHLPPGAIHRWDLAASYSSLEQFFNSPFQWALNYPAQLKPSALLSLPGNFQLLGSLAHRVVETLYRDADAITWTANRVNDWFDHSVERIVREEGAILLMPGRRADLEAFRLRFRRSLVQLHEILQAAGVATLEPEAELTGSTALGPLKGQSDLLVTFRDGRRAIVDMKWAGVSKYSEKIKQQTHIQLAIYARLVENNTRAWPAVAYFILRDSALLTPDPVFPGVQPIAVPGASTALLWDRVMTTWQWRRTQIENGALELVREELEPTPDSTPPPGALLLKEPDQRYNGCVHLAGWDVDA
jgi:hypothetical protein